jgi:hypothetical protein
MPAISSSTLGALGTSSVALDDLTDVTLTPLTNGQVLAYNATALAWTNTTLDTISVVDTASIDLTYSSGQISAAVIPGGVDHDSLSGFVANEHIDWTNTTSNLVTTGDGTFGHVNVDYVDFTTGLSAPAQQAGRIYWEETEGTLSVYTDKTGVTLQLGHEQYVRCVNKTGVTITNGQVVYISGAQGNRPTAALADADNTTADKTIGVATHDIPDNEEGYITVAGVVNGIDTSGYTAGDALYVSSTAGALTNVAPVHPKHDVLVGYALNATNNGKILVTVKNAGDLGSLHDVLIDSLSDGHVLQYEASTTLWKNKALSTDHGSLVGLSDDDHTQYLLLDGRTGGQTVYGGTAAGNDLTICSTSNATKGKVIICSQAAFDGVLGSLTLGDTADWGYGARLNVKGTGTSNFRGLAFANVNTDNTNKGAAVLIGPRKTIANAPFVVLGNWDQGTARTIYIGGGQWSMPDANTINFYAASAYDENNGVSGNLRMQLVGSTNTFSLLNSCNFAVNTNTLYVDATNSRVGINNASPGIWLDLSGQSSTLGSARYSAVFSDSTATIAAGIGGGLLLSGRAVTGSSTSYGFGCVAGLKENATSGNTASYMAFFTRISGGSLAERARITSAGNFVLQKTSGIGIQIDPSSPSFGWKDLTSDIVVRGTAGATTPTFSSYRNGIYQYQFTVNDEVWSVFHLPHDYCQASDIYIHVHWSHASASVTSGDVTWGFEVTYAKGHDQAAFPATITTSVAQTASTTQYRHMIAEVKLSDGLPNASQLNSGVLEVDGLILVRTFLSANTMNGTPEPFLHFVDIHYQSTQLATKNKAPDFYT